ncbi:TetR family transcriptional regulator [Limibaculum sp. M0105]|uniref:TetR family transcriptional regulator n=1 Tax=Thermohalobaculum xanthum TaxID=2753746 RepID=A0A8J7MAM7_9RHOB|nr:TetR family transcriptional regulator [Thermohalobaculum xanthum]MBK0401303.1 TetR family transcriptional regulator [Thermohalobaculum xanthum]
MRQTKRDELVRKALEIFYRNGFHATGMDMLVAETGISKTSMYKHFRTKEELILAALRLRDENFRNWLFRRIDELAETPRDKLLAIFDALGEWFAMREFRGCMFIKASAEYQEREHPIHAQSAEHKRLLFDHVKRICAQAGAPSPDDLARQLLILKEGAIVMAVLGKASDAARDARMAAESLLAAAFAGR